MLDKLKIALVLVVIGALSGIIIYGVNVATEEKIVKNRIEQEFDYYKDLFNLDSDSKIILSEPTELSNGPDVELIVYDENFTIIGYVYKTATKNSYGDITILVGIDTTGKISNAVISATTNTPNFVQTIKSKYIGNFVGQDASSVEIYDGLTGASYTYGSVVDVVTSSAAYYTESRGE